jgi:beta-glucosidase
MGTAMLTRREMGLGAAAVALAGCSGHYTPATFPAPKSRQFPHDFVWGVATSAFQIEGAWTADGRGPSIWDVFPRSKIADQSDASVADDSYHRYGEDVTLLSELGAKAYRFSIAWPRIAPTGAGAVNQAGVDYYSRLVDALLAKRITPYATLFHWDLPQGLQERGGWNERDASQRFAEYASAIGEKLGDRVKNFIILNEPSVHVIAGHVLGIHAPGLKDSKLIGPVTHHINLAQGLAIQALRAAHNDLKIGTTLALLPSRAAPGGIGLNGMVAQGFDEIWNRAFLDPLFKGTYPGQAQKLVEASLQGDDMRAIRQPIDFIGANYYAPAYLKFDFGSDSHIALGNPPASAERDAFNREVDPAGMWQILKRLRDEYGNPPVIITENGCSDTFSDGPAKLDDGFRITYLRRHLEPVLSAIEAGSPVGGYFHWTLVDNWEWAEGFRSKFGFVAQDRTSGQRMTKASYAWYKALAIGGLLPAQ